MPRLLDRANVGYGFPTPTAGDRGAGQQAMWDALQALGVQQGATTTITTSQTLTMSNCGEVLVSAASGNVTLTLPTSGTVTDNAVFVFVRTDSSANTVTIQRGSTDTIEGSTSISLAVNQRTTIVMPAGGTVWRKISDTTATGLPDFLNTVRIDVASATTVDLTANAPNTRHINITGTTTINGFTVAAGQCYFVRFNAALTLTNGASLVTQTGANIPTAAGDTCIIRATAANTVEVLCYRGVATEAQAGVVELASAAEALALTVTDRAVSPARLKDAFSATGSAPMFACRAWVNFDGTGTVAIRASGNVSSITDNGVGDYTVNFTTPLPDANYAWALSCNGTSTGMQTGAQLSGTATAPTLISSSQMRFNTGTTTGGTAIDMSHVSAVFFR